MDTIVKTVDQGTGLTNYSIPVGDPVLRDFLAENPKHMDMLSRLLELVTAAVAEANVAVTA